MFTLTFIYKNELCNVTFFLVKFGLDGSIEVRYGQLHKLHSHNISERLLSRPDNTTLENIVIKNGSQKI